MSLLYPQNKRDSFESEEQGGFTSIRELMCDKVNIPYL